MIPNIHKNYNYKNETFKSECIDQKDLYFMEEICKDSLEWQLVYNSKGVYGCYSTHNYFDKCTLFDKALCAKFDLIIPYNWKRVMKSILPRYADKEISDGFVQSYEDIKGVDGYEESNGYSIVGVVNDLKFPFDLRKSTMAVTYHYDSGKKTVYFIFRPYFNDQEWQILKNGKYMMVDGVKYYLMINYYVQKFEFFYEDVTLFTSVHIVDFDGWVSKTSFMGKYVVKLISKKVKNTFVKKVEQYTEDEAMKLKVDPVGRLVLECIKKIEEEENIEEDVLKEEDERVLNNESIVIDENE
jgi:hypothetical protein